MTTRTGAKQRRDKEREALTRIKRAKVRRKLLAGVFGLLKDVRNEARKGKRSTGKAPAGDSPKPAPKRVKFGSQSTSGGLKGGGSGGHLQHHRPDEDWLGAENRRSGDWGGHDPFEPAPKRSESPVGRATGQGFTDEDLDQWADEQDQDVEQSAEDDGGHLGGGEQE